MTTEIDLALAIAPLHAPAAAALVMEQKVRQQIAAELRKRADWLIAQSKERYYTVLAAKADECRHLAEKIEKGLTP